MLSALIRTRRTGAAAAEMALVLPLLLMILFGSFEVGNYFLSAHIVQQGGSRRRALSPPGRTSLARCGLACADGPTDTQIKNSCGPASSPAARPPGIFGLDNDRSDGHRHLRHHRLVRDGGIYTVADRRGSPWTVSAAVPYPSLFSHRIRLPGADSQCRAASRGDGHMNVFAVLRRCRMRARPSSRWCCRCCSCSCSGIIDAGRLMWEYNRAEKATQMGARFAVVTDMIPASTRHARDFALVERRDLRADQPGSALSVFHKHDLRQYRRRAPDGWWMLIPVAAFTQCRRPHAPHDTRRSPRPMSRSNIANVGLGYAGDPNGPDVAPLVTVQSDRTYTSGR